MGCCLVFSYLLLMVKMLRFLLLSLSLSGLTYAGQEALELINVYDPHPLFIHSFSQTTDFPISISVPEDHLISLSSSTSVAENWLKTHAFAARPAAIVVGSGVLCNPQYREEWSLVLAALRNIHIVLQRFGLEKETKLSAAFASECLVSVSSYGDELLVKALLDFLHSSNSTYSISPPHHFTSSLKEIITLVSVHEQFMKSLGFSNSLRMSVVVSHLKVKSMVQMLSSLSCSKPVQPNPAHVSSSLVKKTGFSHFTSHWREKLIERTLSSLDSSEPAQPYPASPTPLPHMHFSIGFPSANVERNPFTPPPRVVPPPGDSFSFSPNYPPVVVPLDPPHDATMPPCIATLAPEPAAGVEQKGLWCLAKPSVPEATLQEAMDYACGDGEADCEEIRPHGSCYYPDNVVAHASYAFNSYWQKYKNSGGSCSFEGTAMLINSDPSFLQCKFILL